MSDSLLTIDDAAKYLKVSKITLRRWTNAGTLPCARVGAKGERRFRRADLDACLDRSSALREAGSIPVGATTEPVDTAIPNGCRHICLNYHDRNELWQIFSPHLLEHLRQRKPVLHIYEEGTCADIRSHLNAEGFDVPQIEETGALRLIPHSEAYLRGPVFVPERMIDFIEATILEYRSLGFESILISGEMSWTLSEKPGTERLLEYERLVNDLLQRYRQVTLICLYDLQRMNGSTIFGAVCCHPYVQLRDRLVPGYWA